MNTFLLILYIVLAFSIFLNAYLYYVNKNQKEKKLTDFRSNLKQFDKALKQEWDDTLDRDTYRKCEILYIGKFNVSIMYLDDMTKDNADIKELFPIN